MDVKKPPKKSVQEFHLPASLLSDPTKEPLQIVVQPYKGITHVPNDLAGNDVATFIFLELNNCFKRAGFVAEGLLPNVIWGFEQAGHDSRRVVAGLTKLRVLGYIRYTDPFGNPIFEHNFDSNKPIWIRYTQKFINCFIRDEGGTIILAP